jgi:16S rRNA processing protein RimM
MEDDLLLVGRVARAHGIRGQVVVNPETDFAEERFRAGQVLLMGPADRAEQREIREVRFHHGRPIIALAGVETIDAAEALSGTELWMPAAALGPLPEGVFYRHDLVGCDVRDTHEAVIGRVTAVEGTLDRSHLIVDCGGAETMIPLVAPICVRVDVPGRRIVVDPPEGLLDLRIARRQAQAPAAAASERSETGRRERGWGPASSEGS